jgi:hypothetical protein
MAHLIERDEEKIAAGEDLVREMRTVYRVRWYTRASDWLRRKLGIVVPVRPFGNGDAERIARMVEAKLPAQRARLAQDRATLALMIAHESIARAYDATAGALEERAAMDRTKLEGQA